MRYPVRRKLISARQRLQPSSQSSSSFICSSFPWNMQQDVDVAGWSRRGILGATDQVEGFHPKFLRIEFCRDPLRHTKTPAPVFVRSPVNELSLGFD